MGSVSQAAQCKISIGSACVITWWRHLMETFSALLAICAGNSPVPGEFPAQRPVTWSFDVFFDLRLDKRLSKQTWGWWLEKLSCPLWRHCNEIRYLKKNVWGVYMGTIFFNPNVCKRDVTMYNIKICSDQFFITFPEFIRQSDALTRSVFLQCLHKEPVIPGTYLCNGLLDKLFAT